MRRPGTGRIGPPLVFAVALLAAIGAGNWWVYGRIHNALDDDLGRRLSTIADLLLESGLINDTNVYSDSGGLQPLELEWWIDPILQRIQEGNDLDAILLLDPRDYVVRYSSSAGLYRVGDPYPWLQAQSATLLALVEAGPTERGPWVSPTVRVGRQGAGVFLKSSFEPVKTLLQDELVAILVVEASPDFFEMLGLLRRTMITGTLLAAVLLLLLLAAWLGLQRQITRARLALEREDRMTALGRLASQVAHEIRNPVGIIKYSAQRMDRWLGVQGGGRRELDPELHEMVAYINEETVRLQEITERYLTYTRRDEVQLRPVDPVQLVASAVEALSRLGLPEGLVITTNVEDGLAAIMADPDQLRQALLNLGVNAAEAMGSSGTITLFARRAPEPDGPRPAGREAVLCLGVEDRGPGIPEKLRERVFEAFFSTREEGNGLGLYIVGRIARAHGGQAFAGAAPAGGARVWLRIPLRRPQAAGGEEVV
jgi:signal transduction histidine kinase